MADFQHILSSQRPGTENNIINLFFGNLPLSSKAADTELFTSAISSVTKKKVQVMG